MVNPPGIAAAPAAAAEGSVIMHNEISRRMSRPPASSGKYGGWSERDHGIFLNAVARNRKWRMVERDFIDAVWVATSGKVAGADEVVRHVQWWKQQVNGRPPQRIFVYNAG